MCITSASLAYSIAPEKPREKILQLKGRSFSGAGQILSIHFLRVYSSLFIYSTEPNLTSSNDSR